MGFLPIHERYRTMKKLTNLVFYPTRTIVENYPIEHLHDLTRANNNWVLFSESHCRCTNPYCTHQGTQIIKTSDEHGNEEIGLYTDNGMQMIATNDPQAAVLCDQCHAWKQGRFEGIMGFKAWSYIPRLRPKKELQVEDLAV